MGDPDGTDVPEHAADPKEDHATPGGQPGDAPHEAQTGETNEGQPVTPTQNVENV